MGMMGSDRRPEAEPYQTSYPRRGWVVALVQRAQRCRHGLPLQTVSTVPALAGDISVTCGGYGQGHYV